jgi:hypothetical protein
MLFASIYPITIQGPIPEIFAKNIDNWWSQKYTRRRSFLQYLNSDFLFYLGWSGNVSTKQAEYNEGCSKLNYLVADV